MALHSIEVDRIKKMAKLKNLSIPLPSGGDRGDKKLTKMLFEYECTIFANPLSSQ